MLSEYEKEQAHVIKIKFKNKQEGRRFSKIADEHDSISALREIGRHSEAKRVILNSITYGIISDCGHHLYEALKCFEKRKFIPAFNLLRKPLLDSLMYLSWIVADEDDFYNSFVSGDVGKMSQKVIGNRRKEIFKKSIDAVNLTNIIDGENVISMLYDPANEYGLYGLFQHAVHLITVERIEIKTSPENFNFIFKNSFDNDIYEAVYLALPTIFLFLNHLAIELFERIHPMDRGARDSILFRTLNGYLFLCHETSGLVLDEMRGLFENSIKCPGCSNYINISEHNVSRLLLTDTCRCGVCKKVWPFPLSWVF